MVDGCLVISRWLLLAAVAAVGVVGIVRVTSSGAAPDPVACTGYPEPRILLESQSWWTPQFQNPADPGHPGTGHVGHIHMQTCYPLYQTIRGDTLHLDVTIKLHDMTGTPGRLIVQAYGDAGGPDGPLVPRCATSDCTYTYAYDFPLARLHYSGWREFHIFLPVSNADGTKQYNIPRWYVNMDNGKPAAPIGSTGSVVGNAGGDSWYRSGGSAYARVNIQRTSIPWDETTGTLTPVSGIWTPTVEYTVPQGGFAYIDPAFHNVPPSKGTIVYETNTGPEAKTLSIDTAKLSNGPHRLVIGATRHSDLSTVGPAGDNTGVLVIPFVVYNKGCV
jgi:hypothetical protein